MMCSRVSDSKSQRQGRSLHQLRPNTEALTWPGLRKLSQGQKVGTMEKAQGAQWGSEHVLHRFAVW